MLPENLFPRENAQTVKHFAKTMMDGFFWTPLSKQKRKYCGKKIRWVYFVITVFYQFPLLTTVPTTIDGAMTILLGCIIHYSRWYFPLGNA